jgi:predicted RNA binding protein YcfA (HicA-like mRNA interferase family)
MSKAPRITGKQLVKVLERTGFYLHRIEGSHHIMKRDFPPARVSVPVHAGKILKLGTYHRIIKIAGLTNDDVRKLL